MGIITSDIVKNVALLARLRLEGKELTQFATQLDAILQYVHQLQSVPTDRIQLRGELGELLAFKAKRSPWTSLPPSPTSSPTQAWCLNWARPSLRDLAARLSTGSTQLSGKRNR